MNNKVNWRATSITIIAMIVILLVDSKAKARIETYQDQLKAVET
ncbi:hypothetical protein [Aureicoccus marinus]|nr:hypothetical protein [Aureicoccus marinus]